MHTQTSFTIPPGVVVDISEFAPLLELPTIKRLWELKQLGALFWRYPGATHTRMEHSLLTEHLGDEAAEHHHLKAYDRKLVALHGLTHDMNHTPYSHELHNNLPIDLLELARQYILEPEFQQALQKIEVKVEDLLSFFTKEEEGGNPLRAIVSDKILGADKLAYLLRDGLATGMSGHDNIHFLLRHTRLVDGELGIDEEAMPSALRQIFLYHTAYAHTYFSPESRLNQRLFTLLGQIALERDVIPSNWYRLTDPQFDNHILKSIDHGDTQIGKLFNGIRDKSYTLVAALRLPDARLHEQKDGQYIGEITERQYKNFMERFSSKRLTSLEAELGKTENIQSPDLIIAPGGSLSKLEIDDPIVYKSGGFERVYLMAHLHPEVKAGLYQDLKKHAMVVRLYVHNESPVLVSGYHVGERLAHAFLKGTK